MFPHSTLLFSQGSEGLQRQEYNVCSDDTAFQCSSNQKLITIIHKSSRTFSIWLDTMITNQLLLLLMLSMLWPSTAMPFTPGNIGKLFGMPESDGRILQRSKRGWMWNQFFLLEEYTGNDHQYVGKVTCPKAVCRLIVGGLACWRSAWCQRPQTNGLPGSWLDQIQSKCRWTGVCAHKLPRFHHNGCSVKSPSSTDLLLDRCHFIVITISHWPWSPPQQLTWSNFHQTSLIIWLESVESVDNTKVTWVRSQLSCWQVV